MNLLEATHLLNNGHLRCGIFKGHISLGFMGQWPPTIRLTANPTVTDCPNCRAAAELPPIKVSERLEVFVENIKILNEGKPAMEVMATALEGSITILELVPLAQRVAEEMQAP